MNDKIVGYEDLATLRNIRTEVCRPNNHPTGCTCPGSELLDRLIAAAEADRPPLPEGWVLLRDHNGSHRALWHNDGVLFDRDDSTGCRAVVGSRVAPHDRLTPLRPPATEADVEKAARAAHTAEFIAEWSALHEGTRASYKRQIRAAFEAAGIEVTP